MEEGLKEIVRTYGEVSQIEMAIEEMSELTKALLKHRRAIRNGENTEAREDDIAEEMADVWIMLKQLEIIFDNKDKIKNYMDFKVQRQLKRMEVKNESDNT